LHGVGRAGGKLKPLKAPKKEKKEEDEVRQLVLECNSLQLTRVLSQSIG
jgi:hypothetical protein